MMPLLTCSSICSSSTCYRRVAFSPVSDWSDTT